MLKELETILREAGQTILDTRGAKVYVKPGEANFVTDCDLRVQELVRGRLAELCPGAAFIGEESDANDYAARLSWIVDPLDGTTNFMHGYRRSCVSAALVENGKPVLGGVCDPYMGEMFLAETGKGAFCGGERLHASDFPPERAIVSFGTTPYDRTNSDATFGIVRELFRRTADVRRSGSAALDLCYVAAGRADGFFELTLQPWDIAAGVLMVSEAGGIATDFSGSPHTFARGQSVVAASETLYPVMLGVIRGQLG
jgi:myo-inositol-1(or 4)-monophosphatase